MSSIIEEKKKIKQQKREEEKREIPTKYKAVTVCESEKRELTSKEIACIKHPKIIKHEVQIIVKQVGIGRGKAVKTEVVKIPKIEPLNIKIESKVKPPEQPSENNISTKSERSTIKIPKIKHEIKLPQFKSKKIKTEFKSLTSLQPPTIMQLPTVPTPEIKLTTKVLKIPKKSFPEKIEHIKAESPKVELSPIRLRKLPEKTISREEVAELRVEEREEEVKPELEVENVLNELLPVLKGGRKFSLQRPLCIIAIGKSSDGIRMVEHLMSTKYTYHGEYRFLMGLPWQKEDILKKIEEEERRKTGVRHIPVGRWGEVKEIEEDPYSLITSERLIVSIPSANRENKAKIVRGLREISKRGPKCVILYTSDVEPFENLENEVLDVDVNIIALPEYSEETSKLIGEMLGVNIPHLRYAMFEKVDDLWGFAVRFYEDEISRIDCELPTKEVDYLSDRESEFHYLMKRIVYYYLKRWGYKIIEVEKLQSLTDDKGRFIGYVRPDIIADGEYWEVETGYPTEEEKELLKEPWNPYSRLIWKLSKYKEKPSKICVVFPAIYAHLFRDEIVKVKRYFKERDIAVSFYTIYLQGKGELKKFA